jgi:hypothetical protein
LRNDRGHNLLMSRIDELTTTRLIDLRGGATHEF